MQFDLHLPLSFLEFRMWKAKQLKSGKATSLWTGRFITRMLIMFSVMVIIILALGIISTPNSSSSSQNHNVLDLPSILRSSLSRPRTNLFQVRTTSATFLRRGFDQTKRIADFTFLPVEHGEGQVLHYQVGQKYEPHFDYFLDEFNTVNGGQRIATLLMYLSDVEYGGETASPNAKGNISDVPYWNELSECGKEGLSVKPRMGDALLFWSIKPDASVDPSSLHGGCPVVNGNKWSATKWIRENEYQT